MYIACLLARYPWKSLRAIEDAGDRTLVFLRGYSVVLSPSAVLYAIQSHGAAVYGSTVGIMYFSMVAAIGFDVHAVSRSWERNSHISLWGNCALWVGRFLIACASIMLAFNAGLLSERSNLQAALRAEARESALRDPETAEHAAVLAEQAAQLERQILDNDVRYAKRGPLVRDKAQREKLAAFEELGASGVDAETNEPLSGRKGCDARCQVHRAAALSLAAQIADLDAVPGQNAEIKKRISEIRAEHEALLTATLPDVDSAGSLFRGLRLADMEVVIKVCFQALVIVMVEFAVLIIAHAPTPENLYLAKEAQQEADRLRIDLGRRALRAEVQAVYAASRAEAGRQVSPLVVRSGPLAHPVRGGGTDAGIGREESDATTTAPTPGREPAGVDA